MCSLLFDGLFSLLPDSEVPGLQLMRKRHVRLSEVRARLPLSNIRIEGLPTPGRLSTSAKISAAAREGELAKTATPMASRREMDADILLGAFGDGRKTALELIGP
jgi:hypothetical protein